MNQKPNNIKKIKNSNLNIHFFNSMQTFISTYVTLIFVRDIFGVSYDTNNFLKGTLHIFNAMFNF